MPECAHDQRTCHCRGHWHGFGPVSGDEELIFAAFDQTSRNADNLTANSFKNLAGNAESVARGTYVSWHVFRGHVVQSGQHAKGAFVGIATAKVESVRRLRTDIPINNQAASVRSICVIDLVEDGDYDGHATMGFGEPIESLGQTLKGKKRLAIRMDLAKEFSKIHEPQTHHWPSRIMVGLRRFTSIGRVTFKVALEWLGN